MESLASYVNKDIIPEQKEEFHEFLRANTNKFTQNVYQTKDNTFKSLKSFRDNKDIVVLSGDKDSSVVTMNKQDYINKVNKLIDDGIQAGKYERTTDTTEKDLHNFQTFLYKNFQKHKDYDKLRPKSNQPGRFFATAKTYKFE